MEGHTRTHNEGGSLNKEVKSRRPVWPCLTMTTLTTPSNMSNLYNIAHYGRSGERTAAAERTLFRSTLSICLQRTDEHCFKTLSSRTPKRLSRRRRWSWQIEEKKKSLANAKANTPSPNKYGTVREKRAPQRRVDRGPIRQNRNGPAVRRRRWEKSTRRNLELN